MRSDDSDFIKIPDLIPREYWDRPLMENVRTIKFGRDDKDKFPEEVSSRFPDKQSRLIYLKCCRRTDNFPEVASKISVNGRPLTLTHYRTYGTHALPKLFTDDKLWELFGEDIITAYAMKGLPKNLVKENIRYPAFKAWNLLTRDV